MKAWAFSIIEGVRAATVPPKSSPTLSVQTSKVLTMSHSLPTIITIGNISLCLEGRFKSNLN